MLKFFERLYQNFLGIYAYFLGVFFELYAPENFGINAQKTPTYIPEQNRHICLFDLSIYTNFF